MISYKGLARSISEIQTEDTQKLKKNKSIIIDLNRHATTICRLAHQFVPSLYKELILVDSFLLLVSSIVGVFGEYTIRLVDRL